MLSIYHAIAAVDIAGPHSKQRSSIPMADRWLFDGAALLLGIEAGKAGSADWQACHVLCLLILIEAC